MATATTFFALHMARWFCENLSEECDLKIQIAHLQAENKAFGLDRIKLQISLLCLKLTNKNLLHSLNVELLPS